MSYGDYLELLNYLIFLKMSNPLMGKATSCLARDKDSKGMEACGIVNLKLSNAAICEPRGRDRFPEGNRVHDSIGNEY